MKDSWKRLIYIAKKTKSNGKDVFDDDGRVSYQAPVSYRMNVLAISGKTDIEMYGQKANKMQKAVVDYDTYFGMFEENDKAYLDGAVPTGETTNGFKANYRIDAVINQNKIIKIYFEKLETK